MEQYKNNQKANREPIYTTKFKLDIEENSHYEFNSYNDLLKKIEEYIQNNY